MLYFDVRGNNFNGSIPEFISSWDKIVGLWLLGNNFEGPSTEVFQSLNDLRYLHLSGLRGVNGRQRDLPFPKVNKNLTSLTLRDCSITGEIPDFIGENPVLSYLDLSFNKLTGAIPLFSSNVLLYLYLRGNNLNDTSKGLFTNLTDSSVDVSENNFTKLDLPGNKPENWNLFACCPTCKNNGDEWQKGNQHCNNNQMNDRLFINCGGNLQRIDGTVYEDDSKASGKSTFFLSRDKRWGFSRMGSWGDSGVGTGGFISLLKPYPDRYVFNSTCRDSENIAQSPLYSTARIAPVSLKYYGFCLKNGNYTVKLDFAEILCQAKREAASVQTRIFDVDIQGKNVLRNFKIRNESEAGGNISEQFNAYVNDNQLEIHLFWAGKGSVNRQFMYNGPLISAISVFPAHETKKKPPPTLAIVGIVASASLVPASILAYLWKMGLFNGIGSPSITYYSTQDTKAATDNFNPANKLVEGEFVSIYQGVFENGTKGAVKQLSPKAIRSMSKLTGGRKVLETLCKLQHPNLAGLLGYCEEDDEIPILVSELPEDNTSLEAFFDDQELRATRLDWPARVQICHRLAKGLVFLHGNPKRKIVHKYLKPANILLDKAKLIARISDFEFATLFEGEMSLEEDTNVEFEGEMSQEEATNIEKKGEMSLEEATNIEKNINVYMAPECAKRGKITDKADVYSFGAVMLKIISGKKDASDQPKDENVPDLASDQPNDENIGGKKAAGDQPSDENVLDLASDQPIDENISGKKAADDQPNDENVPDLASDQPIDENISGKKAASDQPNDENVPDLSSDQPIDENISGKKAASNLPNDENVLDLSNIWQKYRRTKKREELLRLVDPDLGEDYPKEEAITILELAIKCINPSPHARPTMSEVVKNLEGKIASLSKCAQCGQAVCCCARILCSIFCRLGCTSE